MRIPLGVWAFLIAAAPASADELPRSLDPRLKIELFAEHPQIVTPTGIDVDHAGRVWAIESNTHFRPNGYQGHPSDRLLILRDTDGDRRADDITPFADGFKHAMSVAVRPVWLESGMPKAESGNGGSSKPAFRLPLSAFLATRDAIWLLEDTDGDLQSDAQTRLVHLDTPGDYPHNGLAGFAFDAMGWMYFGFGENLGAEYRIIGSDGTTLSGGGEGGNIYRCRPDGSQLSLWATGFWNPHANCVDAFGRLFSVDNDPDSRPPCRLLHVIQGGDYGYRFRNGRKGLHPFTSWNGEIPGTLPMVAGTGEAPSGLVAYESDGLPDEYLGNLLVTSWGDHRIDRFRLEPRGASFTSKAEPVIVGGEDFRPVGLAVAPDGSLYCTDWVLKDYNLHGKGRIWRISMVEEPERRVIDSTALGPDTPLDGLHELSGSPRLDVRRAAAVAAQTSEEGREQLLATVSDPGAPVRARLECLWALARVPVEVENFRFTNWLNRNFDIAAEDELATAAFRLIGTPQFPLTGLDAAIPFAHIDGEVRPTHEEVARLATAVIPVWSDASLGGAGFALTTLSREAGFPSSDPFVFTAVVDSLCRLNLTDDELVCLFHADSVGSRMADATYPAGGGQHRLAVILTAHRTRAASPKLAAAGLGDADPTVRRAAVQWVAEEGLKDLRPQVEAVLTDGPMTQDLFMATLAALSMLDGVPPAKFEEKPPAEYVLAIVRDEQRPAALRAQALRMLPGAGVDVGLLAGMLKSEDATLRLEAVRSLAESTDGKAAELLRLTAENRGNDETLQAEAVAGLARHRDESIWSLLLGILEDPRQPYALRREALRSLRGSVAEDEVRETLVAVGEALRNVAADTDEVRETADQLALALGGANAEVPQVVAEYRWERPETTPQWLELLGAGDGQKPGVSETPGFSTAGDAEAGRRAFFHAEGAGCFKCHTVNGRGGKVGPDLSVIARTMDRTKLAESILEPSKEIPPQFTGWTVVLKDGTVHTGLILSELEGKLRLGTPEGTSVEINDSDVEERQPSKTSVMPDKLEDRLTVGEFRDLLAFLETLK